MATTYELTVNIESMGTAHDRGGKSYVGHMWYSLQEYRDGVAYGTTYDFGFGPGHEKNIGIWNKDRD